VRALDMASGDDAFHYFTTELPDENGASVWSSVGIDVAAGLVFASTGNNYTIAGGHSDAIHAFDLQTGDRQWVKQVRAGDLWTLLNAQSQDTDFGANPILAEVDGREVVAAGDKASAFWMLDRTTGEIVWGREDLTPSHTPNNGGVLNNGAWDGEHFLVIANDPSAGTATLFALDPADGTDAWTAPLPELNWGMISVANGVVFAPAGSVLHLFDASNGEELGALNTGGTITAGAAAIVDGKVIVPSGLQYPFAQNGMNNNQVICYGLP